MVDLCTSIAHLLLYNGERRGKGRGKERERGGKGRGRGGKGRGRGGKGRGRGEIIPVS